MSKEITIQDVHSVIEKEITEWIELGEDNPPKVQEQIKVRVDTLRMLQGKFKSQLTQSDRELELKVLRGEWLPKIGEPYIAIYKNTGEFVGMHPYTCDEFMAGTPELAYCAPPELAQTLSSVIRGDFKPTDKDAGSWMYVIDGAGDHRQYVWKQKYEANDFAKYFFTAAQRDSFARQQEEKGEEPEKKFYWYRMINNTALRFDAKFKLGSDDVDNETTQELNRIRTELARLTKLHPKD